MYLYLDLLSLYLSTYAKRVWMCAKQEMASIPVMLPNLSGIVFMF